MTTLLMTTTKSGPQVAGCFAGSVTLGLRAMRGTCSLSALLLQISGKMSFGLPQTAQVSWHASKCILFSILGSMPCWNVMLMTNRRYSIHSAWLAGRDE